MKRILLFLLLPIGSAYSQTAIEQVPPAGNLMDRIKKQGWIYVDMIGETRLLATIWTADFYNFEGLEETQSQAGDRFNVYKKGLMLGETEKVAEYYHISNLDPALAARFNNPVLVELSKLLPGVELRPYKKDSPLDAPCFMFVLGFYPPSKSDDLIFYYTQTTTGHVLSLSYTLMAEFREYMSGKEDYALRVKHSRFSLKTAETSDELNYRSLSLEILNRKASGLDGAMAKFSGNLNEKLTKQLAK